MALSSSANSPFSADPLLFDGDQANSSSQHHPINLLDIHGTLMVIAWLGLIPGAIFAARYLRGSWPEKSFLGMKIWFHIHRTLNFIAVLLIVISTLLAFYARGMWTGPWFGRDARMNTSYGAWHSLFGLFAIVLAIRQPFNALLRCAPDHPRRPLFNWMHRIAGLVAYIFAMVPLFIGVFVRRILHRNFCKSLLISYQIFLFLLILVAEFINLVEKWARRRQQLVNDEEDNASDEWQHQECDEDGEQQSGEKRNLLRISLFFIMLITSIFCSTILVLFIFMHG